MEDSPGNDLHQKYSIWTDIGAPTFMGLMYIHVSIYYLLY